MLLLSLTRCPCRTYSAVIRLSRVPQLSKCTVSSTVCLTKPARITRLPKNSSQRPWCNVKGRWIHLSSVNCADAPGDSGSSGQSQETSTNELELNEKMRNDPEVRSWLKTMQADFAAEVKSTEDLDYSTISSSSDSDSDSGSSSSSGYESDSDSDSDSNSDTKESDSKAEKVTDSSQESASDSSQESVSSSVVDVDRELLRYDYEEYSADYEPEIDDQPAPVQLPTNLQRGQNGVFDLDDLVMLLREENAIDLCVINIPPELHYVDHMVLVTGKSHRHLRALAEYIQWMYKQKRSRKDPGSVRIEGRESKDWLAMDMGNIVLHMFMHATREKYDLETLWTVGAEFDSKMKEERETLAAFSWDDLLPEEFVDRKPEPHGDARKGRSPEGPGSESMGSQAGGPKGPGSESMESQAGGPKGPGSESMESQAGWHGDMKQ